MFKSDDVVILLVDFRGDFGLGVSKRQKIGNLSPVMLIICVSKAESIA
jgi:hypothetical protein